MQPNNPNQSPNQPPSPHQPGNSSNPSKPQPTPLQVKPISPNIAPAISPSGASKIQHSRQSINFGGSTPAAPTQPPPAQVADAPVQLNPIDPNAPAPLPGTAGSKIRMFGQDHKRHEEKWSRTPNTTGVGAIHVKTFHCKLTEDALQYMDQAVNEWLDAHPQYEVKFVGTTIGTMTGKLKEPALICQVWV